MSKALKALAERCEQATAPDRELDAMIAVVLDLKAEASCPARVRLLHKDYGGSNTYAEIGAHWPRLERYTASIDAALTLVPEGYIWAVTNMDPDTGLVSRSAAMISPNPDADADPSIAASPALALTAATLRFLASADTHPKDGDVQQAPLVSGAVPNGETHK